MRLVKNISGLPSGQYAVLTRSRNLSSRRRKAISSAPIHGWVMVADLFTDTREAVPKEYAIEHNLVYGGTITI